MTWLRLCNFVDLCTVLPQVELSEDARVVEILIADLEKVGVKNNVFQTVQRHGYLRDWSIERWERVEMELKQGRLFQRRLVVQCSSALVAACSFQTP